MPKKKILINQVNLKLNPIAKQLDASIELIKPDNYFTPLKKILMHQSTQPLMPVSIHDSILIMCYFKDEEIDQLLALLKENQITIDYKAILTPYNQEWNLLRLYNELKKEKKGMK